MKKFGEGDGSYFKILSDRGKQSHAHTRHQLIGLEIADILGDRSHKSLYIKLAKEKDPETLLRLAKSIGDKPDIRNRAAYFMSLLGNI